MVSLPACLYFVFRNIAPLKVRDVAKKFITNVLLFTIYIAAKSFKNQLIIVFVR